MFAVGSLTLGTLFLSITEDDLTEYDDDTPMTLTELRDSIRRARRGSPLGRTDSAVAP